MKYRAYLSLLVFVFCAVALPAHAEPLSASLNSTSGNTNSQIYVDKEGNGYFENVKVYQAVGKSFFARLVWNDGFVRVSVRTTDATKITRLDGQVVSYADIREGDMLNISGKLESGNGSITIAASAVKDISLQQRPITLAGTVKTYGTPSGGFTLTSKTRGDVLIATGTTTVFTKGSLTVSLDTLSAGDVISKVEGLYDPVTNTLQATKVVVYVDMSLFKKQTFEGTFVSQGSEANSLQVEIKGVVHTVYVATDGKVIDKKYNPTNLARFMAGDKVRVYGTREEVRPTVIQASIVRNTKL